jgi:hypothetical protein
MPFSTMFRTTAAAASLTCALFSQPPKQPAPAKTPPKSIQAQSSSSISSTTDANGSEVVEIHNFTYEVTGTDVPGLPGDERLLLRKTIHSKETLGDIGIDATITLEAWRFGDDIRQKPMYAITASGTDGHTLDNSIFVADRGLEEVDWLSIYKLGTGQRLFDTYVPLVSFSVSKEFVTTRYVGLEVPPDDTADARLKQPNVVAVLSYASEDRVLREALLTSDDPKQAQLLRSYTDTTRTLAMLERQPVAATPPGAKPREPLRTLKLTFSQNYPSPPDTKDVIIPLQGDDLDLVHTQLPPRLHIAVWKR